jgi:hypothetical protein
MEKKVELETVYDSIKKIIFSRSGMNLGYKVILAKKNDKDERVDSIYSGKQKKNSYNRDYDIQNVSIQTSDFIELSISNNRESIFQNTLISYHNISQFRESFEEAIEMFSKAGIKENYYKENGEFIPAQFQLKNRNRVVFKSGTGTIAFIPDVMENGNNQPNIIACRVVMNNDTSYVKVPLEHFLAFNEVLKDMNIMRDCLMLYTTAVAMGITE